MAEARAALTTEARKIAPPPGRKSRSARSVVGLCWLVVLLLAGGSNFCERRHMLVAAASFAHRRGPRPANIITRGNHHFPGGHLSVQHSTGSSCAIRMTSSPEPSAATTDASSSETTQNANASSKQMNNKRTKNNKKNVNQSKGQLEALAPRKPRILCLHGKFQSGATFSNKIAGARRKLQRVYELDFLDGPIDLIANDDNSNGINKEDYDGDSSAEAAFAWWLKEEDTGKHIRVQEGLEFVLDHIRSQPEPYHGLLGFSQGGALVTALCMTGQLPRTVQAVVTAGSPHVQQALDVALSMAATSTDTNTDDCHTTQSGLEIAKLHLAGKTDAMIPVASTQELCDKGGNGTLLVHDQGHLFPTRAVRVNAVLEFLAENIPAEASV